MGDELDLPCASNCAASGLTHWYEPNLVQLSLHRLLKPHRTLRVPKTRHGVEMRTERNLHAERRPMLGIRKRVRVHREEIIVFEIQRSCARSLEMVNANQASFQARVAFCGSLLTRRMQILGCEETCEIGFRQPLHSPSSHLEAKGKIVVPVSASL